MGSPPLCPTRLHRPACLQGVSVGGAGARGRSSKAEKRKAFGPNSEGFCPSSRWEAMWGRAGVLGGVKRREAMIDRFTIHERERRGGESRVGGERGRERERERVGERETKGGCTLQFSLSPSLSSSIYLSLSPSSSSFPPPSSPGSVSFPVPLSLSLSLSVSQSRSPCLSPLVCPLSSLPHSMPPLPPSTSLGPLPGTRSAALVAGRGAVS